MRASVSASIASARRFARASARPWTSRASAAIRGAYAARSTARWASSTAADGSASIATSARAISTFASGIAERDPAECRLRRLERLRGFLRSSERELRAGDRGRDAREPARLEPRAGQPRLLEAALGPAGLQEHRGQQRVRGDGDDARVEFGDDRRGLLGGGQRPVAIADRDRGLGLRGDRPRDQRAVAGPARGRDRFLHRRQRLVEAPAALERLRDQDPRRQPVAPLDPAQVADAVLVALGEQVREAQIEPRARALLRLGAGDPSDLARAVRDLCQCDQRPRVGLAHRVGLRVGGARGAGGEGLEVGVEERVDGLLERRQVVEPGARGGVLAQQVLARGRGGRPAPGSRGRA